MSEKNIEAVHALLDELMAEYPGQFPDGYDFMSELQAQLKEYVEDGQIDDWGIHPMSAEGFKIVLTQGGNTYTVLRNPDDGGKI